jgi:hypothetical protein
MANKNNITSNGTPSQVRTADARRKAYAVFPQDAMLKKSLPRRSKKKVIETNM